MRRSRVLTMVLLAVFGIACAGDGTGVDVGGNGNGNGNGGGGNGGEPTLSGDVQPIFTGSCALSGCHAGANPAQGMNLSPGLAFSNTVGVPSVESSLLRIAAGMPDDSYLVHKIQGTQGSVGGSGGRMPLTGCCLSTDQMATIRAWIAAGAQNN